MTDAMGIGAFATAGEGAFRLLLDKMDQPRILELGTLRWEADRPTHHKDWAPDADWVLSDISPGTDVDVVADAHDLTRYWLRADGETPPFEDESFDAYIAVSLFEHLERPWRAAQSAERVLRSGGVLYVATHQTFPIHGYPDDYFRFSDRALRLIFEDAGFEVLHAGYAYPCQIIPPPEVTRWNPAAPCWLNVEVAAVKP
jgi:SAM-dependent methyltransferase